MERWARSCNGCGWPRPISEASASDTTGMISLGDYDVLTLTQPELVTRVHAEYLASGSDIVQTNTFGGTAVTQAGYGLASIAYELNLAAARLAKSACDAWTARTPHQPRFVAGTIGPTDRSVVGGSCRPCCLLVGSRVPGSGTRIRNRFAD